MPPDLILANPSHLPERRILEVLSSLSYQTGELSRYLQEVAQAVSELIGLDWSTVTLCREGFERVLASTIDLGDTGDQVYSLHGTLTGTVVERGCSIVVEDATLIQDYGQPPAGYRSYLGVPLRMPNGEVIGTICSFSREPRQFTADEVQLTEIFAERAATAIDNYQLYQKQQQFNETLEAEVIERTIELRATQSKLMEINNQLEQRVEQRTAELQKMNAQLQAEINERTRAQEERLRAIASLAEVGELAAMIVHEIRNPLTTIWMGLNAFKRLELSNAARERLQLAIDEAERLRNLLNEILLYAKPQVLQFEELELNQWITDLLATIRTMPAATQRQIEFIPASTKVKVCVDKDKLKQVFINLISNACEAVSEGEVITWRVEPSRGQVYIRVQNGGNPIPPEVLPQLTRPFYTTKSSGTGLGLAIVKRIVEAHSGELSIESSPAGTTVTVHLNLQ